MPSFTFGASTFTTASYRTMLKILNQSVTEMSEECIGATSNQSIKTTTDRETDQWTQYQVIALMVFGSISITTVLTNALVLFLFLKSRKVLRLPSHILLANLGCADLLVGLIVMPILASMTVANNNRWLWGKEMCWAFGYLHYLLCATSTYSMVLVTVERYIGVRYPLRHKRIVSKRRAFKAAAISWILASLFTATPLTLWPQSQPCPSKCIMNLNSPFLLFISFAVYWIPVSLEILLYALIFFYAMKPFPASTHKKSSLLSTSSRKFVKDNGSSSKRETEATEDNFVAAKNRQINLAKKLAVSPFVMLVMFGPLFFVFILKGLGSDFFDFKLLFVAGWVRYCNSCVNPFIFAFAVPGYRREFYRICLNQGNDKEGGNDSGSFSSCESSNCVKEVPKFAKLLVKYNQKDNKPCI